MFDILITVIMLMILENWPKKITWIGPIITLMVPADDEITYRRNTEAFNQCDSCT